MSQHKKSKATKAYNATKEAVVRASDMPPCQLYLISPPAIEDLSRFGVELDAALAAAPSELPIACLQIRLKDMNGTPLEDSAIIQAASVITLILGRMTWTIFHPESCLAGMPLLA